MISKFQSYFRKFSPNYWTNIGLTVILTFYIVLIGYFVTQGTVCQEYAFDYCAYWSVGKIMNSGRTVNIYNRDVLLQYQKDIYNPNNLSPEMFHPVEAPYLPIFVIPLRLLAFINLKPSFLVWAVVNTILLILYLIFFTEKVTGSPIPLKILLVTLLSFPVFINMREGQLNVWLLICAGEYLRAYIANKPLIAGLWLGGWLLKPQLLVIILALILITHSFKVFKGFLLSSLGVTGISFILIGIQGFRNLLNIVLESASGGFTSNSVGMTNWRMLGEHIATFTSQTAGETVVIAGTLTTVIITIYVFRRKISDPNQFMIASLGIFAATCAATWHSHPHMSIILIPPMLYLSGKKQLSLNLLTIWAFTPVLFHILGHILLLLLVLANFSTDPEKTKWFIIGFPGFVLSLFLLGWAIVQYNHLKEETSQSTSLDF